MARIEVTIDGEGIQQLLRGDRGLADVLERVLNDILEVEITEPGGGPTRADADATGFQERSLRAMCHHAGGDAGAQGTPRPGGEL